MTRVAVVGGGAIGLSTAVALADRDFEVAVYERATIGSGATGHAAGIVYDAFAEDIEATLAKRSLRLFRHYAAEGLEFATTPYLWFATESGPTAEAVRRDARQMARHNLDVERVTPTWIRRRYPQLRTDDVVAAAVAHDAGIVDPDAFVKFVTDRARVAGVEIHERTPVSLETDPLAVRAANRRDRVDHIVVAAGVDTGDIVADVGVSLPVGRYRSQAAIGSGPATPTWYDASTGYYSRPHRHGLIAGRDAREATVGMVPTAVDRDFPELLRSYLSTRLINFDGDIDEAWAGCCTATPDRYPLVGKAMSGIVVATGWHGHGLMLAPGVGELVAESLCGEAIPRAFDPQRFDGDESVSLPTGVTAPGREP